MQGGSYVYTKKRCIYPFHNHWDGINLKTSQMCLIKGILYLLSKEKIYEET